MICCQKYSVSSSLEWFWCWMNKLNRLLTVFFLLAIPNWSLSFLLTNNIIIFFFLKIDIKSICHKIKRLRKIKQFNMTFSKIYSKCLCKWNFLYKMIIIDKDCVHLLVKLTRRNCFLLFYINKIFTSNISINCFLTRTFFFHF